MATGEEKSKWNGTLDQSLVLNNEQLFEIEINYPGKKPIHEVLAHGPATLRQLWRGKLITRNKLLYGDNLEVLASLACDPSIRGQVRLVYIDPPFATNKVFKSRSRKDAYHDLLEGAAYLEFMRERLIFLRELLAEDGSIYIHLDSTMLFHVKILMDELFGRSNFRNFITRRKCNPKNYTRNQYGNISDYILFYTKSPNYLWNRPHISWTPERAFAEYQYIEKETGRRYKKVPIHAPGERNGATGQPWRGMLPPPGKHWQYPPETLEKMDARGEIYWSPNGNPRRKIYLDESKGVPLQDIWLDVKDAHNQNIKVTGYPTEKPVELLKRIIEASSNPNDLVLDCFSGSGTTLSSAAELKRDWIGIDNSSEAIRTTLKRFLRGLEPLGDFVNSDKNRPKQQELPSFHTFPVINNFELLSTDNVADSLSSVVMAWKEAIGRYEG